MAENKDRSEEQKDAEAEVDRFRQNLGPFVVAAEETRMAMVFTDAKVPDNPIVFANDAFLELSGYARDEVLGQSFNSLMARGADAEALDYIEASFAGHATGGREVAYRRRDGSTFWSAVLVSPVRDAEGDIAQHFASFVDLTDHKREQATARMLIDELNHRVKNTLATVQSIVAQALRRSSDAGVIREAIESRLFALSRSHDLLTRENWQGAGLRDLVNAAMEPFEVANGRPEHFVVAGPNVRISPNASLALGVALHELATNAVKYGALSTRAGSVTIDWTIEPAPDGDRVVLTWREKNGPAVMPPSRKGFGSRVIERGLTHELNGSVQLDFPPEGAVCTIAFPVPRGSR